MIVKMPRLRMSGTHPPCGSLRTLAKKKIRSRSKNPPMTTVERGTVHFQTRRTTWYINKVVMTMEPETANP
jgi:hypothetical protein